MNKNSEEIIMFRKQFLQLYLFGIFFSIINAQAQVYYYANGERVYIAPKIDHYVICFKKSVSQEEKGKILFQNELIAEKGVLDSEYLIVNSVNRSENEVKNLSIYPQIKSVTNLFTIPGTNSYFTITDGIIVKFRPNVSENNLISLISEHILQKLEKDWLGERVYLLKTETVDEKSTIELANRLFESNLTEFCHPDFITFGWAETDDYYYYNQWNLSKISAPDAWTINTGSSSIIIAILDSGVESDHPDLEGDLVTGYDVVDDDNTTDPYGDSYHGTACAGIAAALTNNLYGIAGVGYNCKIMPIQFTHGNWMNSSNFASGINWARTNGAHIISISGYTTVADVVNNAINSATSNGRSGLGCIIVKSAGNTGGSISFPGKHPKVIAVGATNQSDNRYSYSSYGADLDVMAPSSVYATDLTGSAGHNSTSYISEFTGTSAAAPHVAGLAGLILSEDNSLTEDQVRNIICYSSDDKSTTGWDQYYGWGRINAKYALKSASKQFTTSGTLSEKEVWWGDITITGDVTIPNGMTLAIIPGTNIDVNSGKKITVQGTLIAEGTISKPITFDKSGSSKWWGIKFEDSADDNECILKYCNLQNASYAIYCYKASPPIIYCNINNNTTGIYKAYGTKQHDIFDNDIGYNSLGGVSLTNASSSINVRFYDNDVHHSSYVNFNCFNITIGPSMHGNKFRNSSYNGINLYSTSPYLESNSIYDNNGYGIYCNNSSPELAYSYKPGKNVVAYNGSYGVYIDASSQPVLGNPYPNGQNSYYSNNSYDVYSLYPYPWIAAGDCYWGGSTPAVYGYVWTYPHRSTNPNPDPHSLLKLIAGTTEMGNTEGPFSTESDKDAHKHYDLGYELEQKGNYDAALERYKFVISNYPETMEAEMSLTRILMCYHKTYRSSVALSYMETLSAEKADFRIGGKALGHLTRQLVQDGNYKQALANCNSQAQRFNDSDIVKDALFTKWQIYFDGLKQEENAKIVMNEFEFSFPNDYLLVHMKAAMGEWTPEMEEKFMENLPKRKGDLPEQAFVVEIPVKYTLSGNYPNPFNPETTIKFGLPKESRVTIKIFNVLGQKVIKLMDKEKKAGYHQVRWDARNEFGKKVSAGVYLYRMQAGNYNKTMKMMLLP
jgi:tetratricopeptide (TPR) repeat protein